MPHPDREPLLVALTNWLVDAVSVPYRATEGRSLPIRLAGLLALVVGAVALVPVWIMFAVVVLVRHWIEDPWREVIALRAELARLQAERDELKRRAADDASDD